MELEPGLVIAGKYRLERPLATGGMGSIWVGRHLKLDAGVAIKFMDPAAAESAVAQQRFEREARAAASLRSMHIVHVHDYGVAEGVPYIVMELLNGEDLSRRLRRERRLPLLDVSRILTQAAKGLRRAHEAGVIHRDLKPANIFLARSDSQDDDESVKILDFGIAKEMMAAPVDETTRAGEILGSPHYMSPEQTRGSKDIDQRSDLWSLGVIVFRAVTGYLPFAGDVFGEVMAKIIADPIPLATQLAPDLPPSVDDFFKRAFARERDHRFQSAREMADAFAIIAHDGPSPLWTGEYTQPPGSPRWSLDAMPNLPRSIHPGQNIEQGAPSSALGGYTPFPGQIAPHGELPSAPHSVSQAGFGSPISSPLSGGAMSSTQGSLTAIGGSIGPSFAFPPQRSLAWIAAAAGLLVVGLGLGFFSLIGGPPTPEAPSAGDNPQAPAASPPASASAEIETTEPTAPPETPPLAASASSAGRKTSKPGGSPGVGPRPNPIPRPPPSPPPTNSGKKKNPWGF